MSSADVIDALFERTVDIVQSLPKAGPIQTSYEEKLALYSLYKQATEGDVQGKRPGMLDMLGRAKWDAWAKRRGLTSRDAKQLYVENMLRMLRRFRDRPQAIELIEELENYSGDVAERVMSGALAGSYSDSVSSAGESPRVPRRRHAHDSDDETIDSEGGDGFGRGPVLARDTPSLPPSYTTGGMGPPGFTGLTSSGRQTPQGGRGDAAATSSVLRARSFPQPPPSVEAASAVAVGKPGESEAHSEDENYLANLPPSRTAAVRGGGRSSHQQYSGARYPPAGSQQAQAGPSSQTARTSRGAVPADEGRLYALPPSSTRYPLPPPSESAAGAAAGGFSSSVTGQAFYSTQPSPAPGSQVGASAAGAAPVHHYYHPRPSEAGIQQGGTSVRGAPYAPSSIGGRSGGGGGRGSTSVAGAGRGGSVSGAPTRSQQVDQALQSIQASLAALHERLNRVENQRSGWSLFVGSGGTGANAAGASGSGRRRAFNSAYTAISNALHDIAVLLGLRDPTTAGGAAALAPSYIAAAGGQAAAASAARERARQDLFSAPLRLAIALLNLFVRLALDAVSLALLLSVLLLVVRRVTGRGDPLILLRVIRRWTGVQPRVLIGGAAAAAAARANGGQGNPSQRLGAIDN